MGFKYKQNKPYRPPAPKKPIRLAFGLVEDPLSKPAVPQTPPVVHQFEKQEIVGTLTLKKFNVDGVKLLTEKHLQRILVNLRKIYEEGRSYNTNTIIDLLSENILKISFNFNQSVIDRIKGLDRNERLWDPESKSWHVFIGCIDDLFDILGRGLKITDEAYEAMVEFIQSSYYAAVAPGKLGKLIFRENLYADDDPASELGRKVTVAPGSQLAMQAGLTLSAVQENHLNLIRAQIANFPFKRKPFSHQILGMEFLLQNPCAALLDEMGCGKSFQIASSIAMLFDRKEITRCLIVAPKSLIKTWQDELKMACDVSYTVIEGLPALRKKQLASNHSIFLIHYEGLRLEKETLAQWVSENPSLIVFDESQRIKNINALTTISAKYVRSKASRCFIATGSPIANRPIDLFAQYLVMDNGNTFGTQFPAFKNKFCHIEMYEISQGRKRIKVEKFLGIKNAEELRERIWATSLRRLKTEVLDLPPILSKDFRVELQGLQKTLYAKYRDNVRSELENMSEEEFRKQGNNIVVKLLRLSQIASNPGLLDEKYQGPCAKITELDEILEDVFSDDTKKIILWSHFVGNVNFLQDKYSEPWNAVAHTGEMSSEERNQSVERFQNDPTCKLFIATPQSAKEGLTLLPKDGVTKADTMIYLDLNFDASSYIQSQARFHRIGQTSEKCLVIHLVAETTVDEYIKKTIVDKVQLAAQILDDASQEELQKLRGEGVALNRFELLQAL